MSIKKILSCVLCVLTVMLSVAAPINYASAVETPKEWKVTYDDADINGDGTIKALLIGNSYGLNLHEHMEKFLSQQDRPVLLGDLYRAGATIGDYYIDGDRGVLYYHAANLETEKPETVSSSSYEEAVAAHNWDIIMIQSGVAASVDDTTFQLCLRPLVNKVRDTFESTYGTDAKYSLAWYFTWSRPTPGFCDNVQDYRNMVRVVRTYVEASNEFDVIMPAGTLIQNMRTADFSNYSTGEKENDGICSDGAHADSNFGCYALSYLYYHTLGLEGEPTIFDESSGSYLSINRNAIIKECAGNALKYPQQITESAYKVPVAQRCPLSSEGHILEEATTRKATCVNDGYTTMRCTLCNYRFNTNEIEAFGHDYETVEQAATCTESGFINRTCKTCGATNNETIPAGHSFTDASVIREGGNGASSIKTQVCTACGITRQTEEQTYTADFESAYSAADYEWARQNSNVYVGKKSFGTFGGSCLGLSPDNKLAFSTYGKSTTGRIKNYVQGVELLGDRQSVNTVAVPTAFSMNTEFYTEAETEVVSMVHSGVLLAKDECGYYSYIPAMQANGTIKAYMLYSPISSTNDDGSIQVSGGTTDKLINTKAVVFHSAAIDGKMLDFTATKGETYAPTGNFKGYIDNLITLGLVSENDAIPAKTTAAEQSRLKISYTAVNDNGVITLNAEYNYTLSDGRVLTLYTHPVVLDQSGFTINNGTKTAYSCSTYSSKTHAGFNAAFGPAFYASVVYTVTGYATVDNISLTYKFISDTKECEHESTYISKGYEPNCLKAGRGDDTVCSDCGLVLTAANTLKTKAHTPSGDSVEISATCLEDGGVVAHCTTCKTEYLSEVYEKLGHDFELLESIKPTCSSSGHDKWECKNCSLQKTEEYKAIGHNFSAFIVEKMPTVSNDGVRYIKCYNCADRYYEIIPSIDLLKNAGDADADGLTGINDAVLLARCGAKIAQIGDYRNYIADVNADTKADIADAVLIARYSARLSDGFATGTGVR